MNWNDQIWPGTKVQTGLVFINTSQYFRNKILDLNVEVLTFHTFYP